MWVARGLVHVEDRRETDVGAVHDGAPLILGLGGDHRGQLFAEAIPLAAVHLRLEGRVVDARLLQEQGVELRLDRADRDPAAVAALVGVVEVRAAIQQVRAPTGVRPAAGRLEAVEHRHQRGRAVAHGAVDHLPLAGFAGADHPGHQPEGEVEGAAAEIAHQVQRRDRFFPRADGVQRAGDGDVVHVVAGGLGVGPELAPAGHPAIDQLRIALQGHVRTETQALHHPRPEALEGGVGLLDQLQADLDGGRLFQVQRHRAAPAAGDVGLGPAPAALSIDAHHIGAQVRQQHAAERSGPDAGEFDDLQTRQRSLAHDAAPLSRSCVFDLEAVPYRQASAAARFRRGRFSARIRKAYRATTTIRPQASLNRRNPRLARPARPA